MTDRNDIQQLLNRFMAGVTTEAEEHQLSDYFTQHEDIPEQWADYAILFHGFQYLSERKPAAKLVAWPRWMAAAASVAILVAIGIPFLIPDISDKESVPQVAKEEMSAKTSQPIVEKVVAQQITPSKNITTTPKIKTMEEKVMPTVEEEEMQLQEKQEIQPVEDGQKQKEYLSIDILEVKQENSDLRMAMCAMNNEIFDEE